MIYDPPEGFCEKLALVDRNLLTRWNPRISRWQILRQNPRTPNRPPDPILTVCGPNAEFQPLDQRTIDKLYRMDRWRRYDGKRPDQMAALMERALVEQQEAMDRRKKKAADEQYADVEKRVAFEAGKLIDHTSHPRYKVG